MSFYKKFADNLSDDLGRLGLGSDSKSRDGPGQYPPQGYGQPSPQPYQSQPGYYPPPQQQPDYSSPPPQAPYASPPEPGPRPPPPYTPPSDKPPIPSGWTPRWDDQYQRWYYVEEATGRSQWEAPGFDHSAYRGVGDSPGGYAPLPVPYGAPSPGSGGYGQSGQGEYRGDHKEKKGHSGMLYAAGGLAVGAVAGAVIAHELTEHSSDDEHHSSSNQAAHVAAAAAAAPVVYETNNYYYNDPPPAPAPPDDVPGVIPVYNAYGEEIGSSDRESLQEARDDYEEALEEAASSSAGSSELEEVEEAREEYEEEYEEAYYDE